MKFFALLSVFLVFLGCSRPTDVTSVKPSDAGQKEEQYRKEMDEIRKTIKGEVKIKLKRDGKEAYSWEITGKDAQEVLKANDLLAKRLKQ